MNCIYLYSVYLVESSISAIWPSLFFDTINFTFSVYSYFPFSIAQLLFVSWCVFNITSPPCTCKLLILTAAIDTSILIIPPVTVSVPTEDSKPHTVNAFSGCVIVWVPSAIVKLLLNQIAEPGVSTVTFAFVGIYFSPSRIPPIAFFDFKIIDVSFIVKFSPVIIEQLLQSLIVNVDSISEYIVKFPIV